MGECNEIRFGDDGELAICGLPESAARHVDFDDRHWHDFRAVPQKMDLALARDIWRSIESAEKGEMPYEITEPWEYFGSPRYRIGPYEIEVFDDAGGWDYIEAIRVGEVTYFAGQDIPIAIWQFSPRGVLHESYERQKALAGYA